MRICPHCKQKCISNRIAIRSSLIWRNVVCDECKKKSKIHPNISGVLGATSFSLFWLALYMWYVEKNWLLVGVIVFVWLIFEISAVLFSPLVKAEQ